MLFSKKKLGVGIDIGTVSIKVLEIESTKSKPKIVNFAYGETEFNIMKETIKQRKKEIVVYIQELYKKAGIKSKNVVSALPSIAIFSSVISVPLLKNKAEFEQAIYIQSKKFVPMEISEVILDWKILKKDQQKNKAEVLVIASPKNLIYDYVDIFKLANLNLIALEVDSFSLARALLLPTEKGASIIVDVGARTSDIIIVENDIPIISRSIDVGGLTITEKIAENLKVDLKRAEQFKRDIGFLPASESSKSIFDIIQIAFNPVLVEIRYSLDLYKSRGVQVERIILSGGSAFLTGLSEYLEKSLGIKTYLGSALSRVDVSSELKDAVEENAPRLAVSIGLALRALE